MYRPYTSPIGGSGSSMDVECTLRGLTQDFSMNFNTGNYDQVGALFSSDGQFMAPHHESATGPKAIERKLRDLGEAGFQDLHLDSTRIEYSGDMAVEMGRYSVSIVEPNGVRSADHGKFVKVWRRLGVWRMLADCWSSSMPMSAAATGEQKPLAVSDKVTVISNDVPKSA